jgi:hypothetical protein
VPANRIFVDGALVDQWVTSGSAELAGGVLRALGSGPSFAIEEALHVVREVTGGTDLRALTGRVLTLRELTPLGAEILDRSMVLSDLAYDVAPGYLVAPQADASGEVPVEGVVSALSALSAPPPDKQSDEELLARYLIQKL